MALSVPPTNSNGSIPTTLTPTGVAAATYTNPTITVDQYGRITFASPGVPVGASTVLATLPLRSSGSIPATLSIDPASLAVCGAVQLCDAVDSTSTDKAATPSAVKQAYDLASAANTNVGTALATSSAAFEDASTALTASTTANANALKALGDAFTAQATANTALATANTANTTVTSSIALATTADINATGALAQANLRIPCSAYQVKGDILIGCGNTHYSPLAVGADGAILLACSACPLGITWAPSCLLTSTTKENIPCSSFSAKGQLLVGCSTATTYAALSPGTNGQVLTACSTCPTGLYWAAPATTACYQNRLHTLVAGSMPVGTFCKTLFTEFGSGLYPVELTVTAEMTRAGVAIAAGNMYLWSTAYGPSTTLNWRMSGGEGGNQLTQNSSLTWVFPPAVGASYGIAIGVSDNSAPRDFFTSYVTGVIKEIH